MALIASVNTCDVYHVLFNALRLHFNAPSYDIFKYKGKVKNVESCPQNLCNTYLKIASKFSTQKQFAELFIATRLKTKINHPTDLLKSESLEMHSIWKSRIESISYRFKSEIKSASFNDTLTGVMSGNISPESGVIHQILSESIVQEFYLKSTQDFLIKYKPFLLVWKYINQENLASCEDHINNLK